MKSRCMWSMNRFVNSKIGIAECYSSVVQQSELVENKKAICKDL